jgi:BMFP domain-containing protein YqiC
VTKEHDLDIMANEIRQIYATDKLGAGNQIEEFLEGSLNGISRDDKVKLLGQLASKFEQTDVCKAEEINVDQEILTRIFSFLLGKKVTEADLCSAELLQRLADSLNTMFDMLNQLVGVINMTFLGQHEGIETIRQVIGYHLDGEKQAKSLEAYLGQISKAFLTAQQAFKVAAEKKVKEIMAELDPDRIAASQGGRFKLGRLRKAESFELYAQKFEAFKGYIESGRFMEELLREFENNCQKLFLE